MVFIGDKDLSVITGMVFIGDKDLSVITDMVSENMLPISRFESNITLFG